MNRLDQKKGKSEIKPVVMREWIDRFLRRWEKLRGYPTIIATLLAVAIYFVVRAVAVQDDPAQLRFVESPSDPTIDLASTDGQPFKPVFSGETYETAERLRECGALLMAVFLSAFEEFQKHGHFPATSNMILADLQKRSLLPPGIEIGDGGLRSSFSELKLNYRSDPFSFEIISVPSSTAQGPAILFRFPLPPAEANSIMYFQFTPRTEPRIPTPFSAAEQLAAAGWSIRHWRGDVLPLDESAVRDLHSQDEWLRSRNRGSQ